MRNDMKLSCWDLDPTDPTIIRVFNGNDVCLKVYLGEAMSLAGKSTCMDIVKELNSSPWVESWHNDTALVNQIIRDDK